MLYYFNCLKIFNLGFRWWKPFTTIFRGLVHRADTYNLKLKEFIKKLTCKKHVFKVYILLFRLSHMGPSQARPLPRLLLPIAVNFKSNNNHFKRDLSITNIFYFPTFFCENIVIVLTFKVAFPSPASPQRSLTSYFFTLSNNLTFFVANLHHFFPWQVIVCSLFFHSPGNS